MCFAFSLLSYFNAFNSLVTPLRVKIIFIIIDGTKPIITIPNATTPASAPKIATGINQTDEHNTINGYIDTAPRPINIKRITTVVFTRVKYTDLTV